MKLVGNTEEHLCQLMQQHDAAAMRTFYNLMASYLTAVCSRYIPQADDMKDVLQDSFLKIYDGIDRFKFRGEGSLRAWAARIVTNESLMWLRKSDQFNLLNADHDLPDLPDEEPDVEDVPAEVLQQFIQELPAGYRTVLNLYVFEDYSHQEIARLLHIKESSSASQLCRAKEVLKNKIEAYKLQKR